MTSATSRAHPKSAKWPRRMKKGILFLVLAVLAVAFILPMYGIIVTSLKSVADVSRGGYWNLPPHPISTTTCVS